MTNLRVVEEGGFAEERSDPAELKGKSTDIVLSGYALDHIIAGMAQFESDNNTVYVKPDIRINDLTPKDTFGYLGPNDDTPVAPV